MTRWEQYEVWVENSDKWEMLASFGDFEVASAMARSRSSRMRLVHAIYEEGKLISQDVLAEVGITREGSS
jgi:hypothetical protein